MADLRPRRDLPGSASRTSHRDQLLDDGILERYYPPNYTTASAQNICGTVSGSTFNRVIEAQKEAEANVILRREETAATRSMAQTAKVLAENPLLVRLKELEAYKELAAKVGQVHVVLGDGALPQLKS